MITKNYGFKGKEYKVQCVEIYSQHPSWFSFEDESCVRDRDWNIKPGDIVLDVGAAYGSYTLTALSQGASKVFAWSPQGEPGIKSEREFLQESLKVNEWGNRCMIFRNGVYDKDGWLNARTQEFHYSNPEISDSDIICVTRIDSWYEEEKKFGSTFIGNTDGKVWMKLDVEGAEVQVLSGAKNFISEIRPKVLVENHLFKDSSIDNRVENILSSHKYRKISDVPYHAVSHAVYFPE